MGPLLAQWPPLMAGPLHGPASRRPCRCGAPAVQAVVCLVHCIPGAARSRAGRAGECAATPVELDWRSTQTPIPERLQRRRNESRKGTSLLKAIG